MAAAVSEELKPSTATSPHFTISQKIAADIWGRAGCGTSPAASTDGIKRGPISLLTCKISNALYLRQVQWGTTYPRMPGIEHMFQTALWALIWEELECIVRGPTNSIGTPAAMPPQQQDGSVISDTMRKYWDDLVTVHLSYLDPRDSPADRPTERIKAQLHQLWSEYDKAHTHKETTTTTRTTTTTMALSKP
jgi:hypothetical protein